MCFQGEYKGKGSTYEGQIGSGRWISLSERVDKWKAHKSLLYSAFHGIVCFRESIRGRLLQAKERDRSIKCGELGLSKSTRELGAEADVPFTIRICTVECCNEACMYLD